jgi:hypothetical protein
MISAPPRAASSNAPRLSRSAGLDFFTICRQGIDKFEREIRQIGVQILRTFFNPFRVADFTLSVTRKDEEKLALVPQGVRAPFCVWAAQKASSSEHGRLIS